MPQLNFTERPVLPGADTEEGATLDFGSFSCTNVHLLSSDGASGLVYRAISKSYYGSNEAAPASLIIKECFPLEISDQIHRSGSSLIFDQNASDEAKSLFTQTCKRFEKSFSTHTILYQSSGREFVTVPAKAHKLNNTIYIISDVSNGSTLDAVINDIDIHIKIKILISLCNAIQSIHNAGYACLDLKPANILVAHNAETGFVGTNVKLFDFDSIINKDMFGDENLNVSHSGDWSSYEQTHAGYHHKICLQSDYYSVGALLFWMLVGRPPSPNEVIHAFGKWNLNELEIPAQENTAAQNELFQMNEEVVDCVRKILNATLVIDPQQRAQSLDELKSLLQKLASILEPFDEGQLAQIEKMRETIKNVENKGKTEVKRQKKKTRKHAIIISVGIALLIAMIIAAGFIIKAINTPPVVGSWHCLGVSNYNDGMMASLPITKNENFSDATMTFYEDGTAALNMGKVASGIVCEWHYEPKVTTALGTGWKCDLTTNDSKRIYAYFLQNHVAVNNPPYAIMILASPTQPNGANNEYAESVISLEWQKDE